MALSPQIQSPKYQPAKYLPEGGSTTEFVIEPGSVDEPPIGVDIKGGRIRWDVMTALFLRFISVLWMAKGLRYWSLIIGLGDLPLGEEHQVRQGIIVGFALFDCAAAVGLWLVNGWGKSLWLILACGEVLAGLFLVNSGISVASAMGALLLMAVFFLLSYAARRRRR